MLTHLLEVGLTRRNLISAGRIQQRPHLFIQVTGQGLQLFLAFGAFRLDRKSVV